MSNIVDSSIRFARSYVDFIKIFVEYVNILNQTFSPNNCNLFVFTVTKDYFVVKEKDLNKKVMLLQQKSYVGFF